MKKVMFLGIEPSTIFANTAEALHPLNKVKHVEYFSDLNEPEINSIARSYQATSYAFANVMELCEWISRSILSVHGLWFSLSEEDEIITIGGKRLCLFSLKKLHRHLTHKGFNLLPISSERYTLGNHEFLAVFLCVHRFRDKQHKLFTELCLQNDNFGLTYGVNNPPKESIKWIHSNAVKRGVHCNYIHGGDIEQNSTFNFGTKEVVKQFQEYVQSSKPRL